MIVGNGFFLFFILTVSIVLGYFSGRERHRRACIQWDVLHFSLLPFIQVVASIAACAVVLNSEYHAIPKWFFLFWCVILAGVNIAFLVALWDESIYKRINKGLFDFVHLGGFWGNHCSKPNNPQWPGTKNNAWGSFALALFVLAFVSLFLHQTSWYWEISRIFHTPEPVAKWAQEQAGGEMQGTPLGSFLGWLGGKAGEGNQPVSLPLFPRSGSWFWIALVTGLWSLYANLWCRRDAIPEMANRLAERLTWWSDDSVATGTSGPTPLARAARSAAEAVRGELAPPRRPPTEAIPAGTGLAHDSMGAVLGKQIVAEGVVDVIKQGPAWMKKFIRWLRKIGQKVD